MMPRQPKDTISDDKPNKCDPMSDQNPTLEYGKATPRCSLRGFLVALSIVIGVAVTLTILALFVAFILQSYGFGDSFVLRLTFDDHLVLILPPLAIIGVVAGTIACAKNESTAAITGVVWAMIAFFASMGASAVDVIVYLWRH